MYEQQYAIDIEHILCNIFDCERFGVGGLVNSDYIRQQPFACMMHGLCFLYATADEDRKAKIEDFFNEYSFYSQWSIDTIVSFDEPSKIIDGTTFELDFSNGSEALDYIIDAFKEIVA